MSAETTERSQGDVGPRVEPSRAAAAVRPDGRRLRPEHGSVTAEAALVLPIVAAFALALVWLVAVGVAQIQVVDAARDAARGLARGDDRESAIAVARTAAPGDADIDVSFAGDTVRVSVTSEQAGPGWLLVPLPALTVRAESTVEVEGDGTEHH